MKIVPVTEKNYELFVEFFPKSFLRKGVCFIGCIEKKMAVGVVGIEEREDIVTIIMLEVIPQFREIGAGSTLLDVAIEYARKRKKNQITISYDALQEGSNRLDYMLAKRSFQLETEKIPSYCLTIEQLEKTPLITQYAQQYKGNSNIVPLKNLSVKQVNEMEERFEEKGVYMISRADLIKADSRRSMVFFVNKVVKGIVLFYPTENKSIIRLAALYVDRTQTTVAVELLIESAGNLIKNPNGIEKIEFTCIEESAFSLAKKLLGERETGWSYLSHGILEL